jgi:hypothetical protein
MNSGKTRLIFDDVQSYSKTNPTSWKFQSLFTWNDYDSIKLNKLELSEKDLAAIGENLLIRLLAFDVNLKDE